MSRKFVDARWIHQRMDAKDARVQRETAAREATREARLLHTLAEHLAAQYPLGTDTKVLLEAARVLLARHKDGGR